MITALIMVPVAVAVGLAVDYNRGSHQRAGMQNALDAAILATTSMPRTATLAERRNLFQNVYLANEGTGRATLASFSIDADGRAHATASAEQLMPTTFMRLAGRRDQAVRVHSAVDKQPSLIETKFEVKIASGWWNKTMTLYGQKHGEANYRKLLVIDYAYNGLAQGKGYGKTTIYSVNANGALQVAQEQTCTSATSCSTVNPTGSSGAVIDVSEMNDLYLEMRGGQPNVMRSNDPATSDRLYIDGVEVERGKAVDIFSVVPCDIRSEQAWEDGGSPVPAPVANADFFYWVTGKCGYTQRPEVTQLTR